MTMSVWRGRQQKRDAKHDEARVEHKSCEAPFLRTRDACLYFSSLARDDVLPGSLSAGSRVSGSLVGAEVHGGARCTYVYVSF